MPAIKMMAGKITPLTFERTFDIIILNREHMIEVETSILKAFEYLNS